MDVLKSLVQKLESDSSTSTFETVANDLFSNWILTSGKERYEITEIEFFYHVPGLLEDPFIAKNELERTFGRWYLKPTGAGLTIGGENRYGSIHIRGVKRQSTGLYLNGPLRTFEALFQDGGDSNSSESKTQIVRVNNDNRCRLFAVPRVGLNLSERASEMTDKLRFVMKPLRFIRMDTPDFADKYVALLFVQKVLGHSSPFKAESSIYAKYEDHFEAGMHAESLDEIWRVNSRLYRLARIMGWLQSHPSEIASRDSAEINVRN